MTIYRRRKMWWVKWMVDGIVYYKSTHTRDYKTAKLWADQIEIARQMPTFEDAVEVLRRFYKQPSDSGIPIENAWNSYINVAEAVGKASISETTMHRRKLIFERFREWLHVNRPAVKTVEAVNGPVAAGYASYLATDLKLKSKSRINNIGELSTVWKLLETASTGVRNPWGSLRPHDVDGSVGRAFSHADEAKVLEAAKKVGKQWHEVCTIMRHTGLRYGDVARLKWANVDGDVLRVTPHKTARHDLDVVIPIIGPVHDVLASLPRSGEYMFQTHAAFYGNRGRAAREALSFREVLTAAGLADAGYTIHSWRHTAATRLAEHGADIETRKAILGHTVDATAERYDHDEHLAAKRDALERAAL